MRLQRLAFWAFLALVSLGQGNAVQDSQNVRRRVAKPFGTPDEGFVPLGRRAKARGGAQPVAKLPAARQGVSAKPPSTKAPGAKSPPAGGPRNGAIASPGTPPEKLGRTAVTTPGKPGATAGNPSARPTGISSARPTGTTTTPGTTTHTPDQRKPDRALCGPELKSPAAGRGGRPAPSGSGTPALKGAKPGVAGRLVGRSLLSGWTSSELLQRRSPVTWLDSKRPRKDAISRWVRDEVDRLDPDEQVFFDVGGADTNTARYRQLGANPVRLGEVDLIGCTSLVLIARDAVYFTHWWETISFSPPKQENTPPSLALFTRTALTPMTAAAAQPGFDQLPANFGGGGSVVGFIIRPTSAAERKELSAYQANWIATSTFIQNAVPGAKVTEYSYNPEISPEQRESTSAGRAFFQYDPNHNGKRRIALYFHDDKLYDEVL